MNEKAGLLGEAVYHLAAERVAVLHLGCHVALPRVQDDQNRSEAIKTDQRQAEAIRSIRSSQKTIRSNQEPSEVHQKRSEAIIRSHLPRTCHASKTICESSPRMRATTCMHALETARSAAESSGGSVKRLNWSK